MPYLFYIKNIYHNNISIIYKYIISILYIIYTKSPITIANITSIIQYISNLFIHNYIHFNTKDFRNDNYKNSNNDKINKNIKDFKSVFNSKINKEKIYKNGFENNKEFKEENKNVKNINKRIKNDNKNKEEFIEENNIENKNNNKEKKINKFNRDFMSVYSSNTIDFILCICNREVPMESPHPYLGFAKPPYYIWSR